MKHRVKKYKPGQRILVRSLDEIPTSFASEDEEREWWAIHELSDEVLPNEDEIERMTENHHRLISRLQAKEAGIRRHRPIPSKRKRA